MTSNETTLLDGPEMDALRELRADVDGPTDAQRQVAWERAQGARSRAASPGGRKGGARPWLLMGVAAVAAGVVAVGVGVAVTGGEDQPAPPASTSTPTNPNPTPYETGPVWEVSGARQTARMEKLTRENIETHGDGRLTIVIPEEADGHALTKALNAAGIPIRMWPVLEEEGYWETVPEYPIDPESGIDTSKEPSGTPYPMERIEPEYVDGAGTALESLTFEEIPTEPVDIQYAE